MIYYQHKKTGQIIGSLNNFRDLINADGSISSITDVIIPDKWIGNGIICHCMTYSYIRDNYKRISKKLAYELFPDFGQWRHIDDDVNFSVTYFGFRYLFELKPMRVNGFGTAFTEKGKSKREQLQTILN